MDAATIDSVVANLAAKLSVPVTAIMGTIQTFGIIDLLILLLSIAGIVLGLNIIMFALMAITSNNNNNYVLVSSVVTLIAGITITIFSVFGVINNLGSVVLWIYNPKAWATKYLFTLLSR